MKKNLLFFLLFIAFAGCNRDEAEVSQIEEIPELVNNDCISPTIRFESKGEISAKKGETVSFTFRVSGRPTPEVIIRGPKGNVISNSKYYYIEWDGDKATLHIYDVDVKDGGQYTITAKNECGSVTKSFTLKILL